MLQCLRGMAKQPKGGECPASAAFFIGELNNATFTNSNTVYNRLGRTSQW